MCNQKLAEARILGEKPHPDRLAIWRQAVDASVNDTLEQTGLRCPDEGITPAKLGVPRNKTAEEYFNLSGVRQWPRRLKLNCESRSKYPDAFPTRRCGFPLARRA